MECRLLHVMEETLLYPDLTIGMALGCKSFFCGLSASDGQEYWEDERCWRVKPNTKLLLLLSIPSLCLFLELQRRFMCI